jgi:uncharacterized membrane protein YfcA
MTMSGDTNYFELAVFFMVTLVTEVLGTIGGFGSSVFFVPAAQFFFSMQVVLGVTGLLHVLSNISKLVLFGRKVNWRLVLWLGISSTVMCLAGAYLTTIVEISFAKVGLGIFLVLLSLFMLLMPSFKLKPGLGVQITGGGIAGFLAGFIGTGGAIRGLVLASFQLEKGVFVGTSAAIDMGVDITRTVVYLDNGYLSLDMVLIYLPVLLVASFLGSYLGKRLLEKISPAGFRKIMLSLILLMGAALIVGA